MKTKLLIITVSMLVLAVSGCADRNDKHLMKGVVTSVGSCGGGEGFFSGPYGCAVSVEVNGSASYWDVYGRVVKGQAIYKPCWVDEDKKTWCTTARTTIPHGY